MAAARRRHELEKPPHVGPVHAWEFLDVFRPSVQQDTIMSANVQAPGSWLKQWQKTPYLSKGCQGYVAPHKHLAPAPAEWSQGTGPMRVFQAPQGDPLPPVPRKEETMAQHEEAMDMDADDAMLFESLLQDQPPSRG